MTSSNEKEDGNGSYLDKITSLPRGVLIGVLVGSGSLALCCLCALGWLCCRCRRQRRSHSIKRGATWKSLPIPPPPLPPTCVPATAEGASAVTGDRPGDGAGDGAGGEMAGDAIDIATISLGSRRQLPGPPPPPPPPPLAEPISSPPLPPPTESPPPPDPSAGLPPPTVPTFDFGSLEPHAAVIEKRQNGRRAGAPAYSHPRESPPSTLTPAPEPAPACTPTPGPVPTPEPLADKPQEPGPVSKPDSMQDSDSGSMPEVPKPLSEPEESEPESESKDSASGFGSDEDARPPAPPPPLPGPAPPPQQKKMPSWLLAAMGADGKWGAQ